MEKRLILAVALSCVVVILYSYLFGTKQEQVTVVDEGTKQEDAVALPGASVTQGDSLQAQGEQPAVAAVLEKEIKVETPLYQAVFANKGATIKSFKLKRYKASKTADSPFVELVNITDNAADFFSVNFGTSETYDKGSVIYAASQDSLSLTEGASPQELTFRGPETNGVSIDQTFRFYPDKYTIDLSVTLTNAGGAPVNGSISTSLKNMLPGGKQVYASFTGATMLLDNKLEQVKYTKMKKGKSFSGQIDWVAYENGYFISYIIPEGQKDGGFYGLTTPAGVIGVTYASPAMTLSSGGKASYGYTLYLGPRDQKVLKTVGKRLEKAVNYGWFDIIAKPLHYLLLFFNGYVGNFGVSIIILTILIKILFWPLTHKSYVSMKEMQKIQPLMAKIRDKYKDDREQQQRELMGLYKTYKINPMSGCLPMLIQIPVFFALYRLLGSSIELRQEPFMLWITDLSAPDRLFNFPFSIPFMYPPYGIPVLTLLMGASMFMQQRMTPSSGDPVQAKMMMFMPVLFIVMFINVPSGLVLYWLVSNIISIGQQYRITKRLV